VSFRGSAVKPSQTGQKRKLAAILAADVAGYSRLVGADEDGTLARLRHLYRATIQPLVTHHGGRVFKLVGDSILAEFPSAVNAVECATALQRALIRSEGKHPAGSRISLRIGIHVGDVVTEGGDLLGDGVNIASRLESLAAPDGVVLSATAREAVGARAAAAIRDLGEQRLHNIERPVHAFALDPMHGAAPVAASPPPSVPAVKHSFALAVPASGPTPLAPPPLPDRPSLAVLPFRQVLPDPSDAYLADGVVDDIIHALGGVKELFVIARTSTLGYSGAVIDVRSIGRDLGVRYVLYGSVRRDRERLRITTELSDALSGQIIHTDRYDGDFHDVFDLQARIAVQVLRAIAPHVRERELHRAMRKPPESITAYERVLQAQVLLDRMDYPAHARAEELLRDAIAHDPSYAAAYTALAFWYIFRIGEGWSSDIVADSEAAAQAARTAMDLDSNDAMAVAMYGYVLSYMYREHERALVLHEQALDICPNSAGAWTFGSATAGFVGNGPLAVERAQLGLRLSPLDAHVFWHEAILAQANYINGAYEEAVIWAMRSTRRASSAVFNLRTLMASLVALGRLQDAAQVAQKLLRVQPNFTLSAYRARCPFVEAVLEPWMERLKVAGLPQ
jgi:adenylate cyclase